MAAATKKRRIVEIGGGAPAKVDADTVVCVRIENTEHSSFVVVHTDQGFAFSVYPTDDQSVNDFYKEVHATVWPNK
jgi:hypothetical protein